MCLQFSPTIQKVKEMISMSTTDNMYTNILLLFEKNIVVLKCNS